MKIVNILHKYTQQYTHIHKYTKMPPGPGPGPAPGPGGIFVYLCTLLYFCVYVCIYVYIYVYPGGLRPDRRARSVSAERRGTVKLIWVDWSR